ncbi:hypothetical protein GCM10027168_60420 [Streptomyces capparidis]
MTSVCVGESPGPETCAVVAVVRKSETWRYTWDAEDRLTSVNTPDGTRWEYLYDALGRRTAKRRTAADASFLEEVLFAWDGTTLAEQTSTSAELRSSVTLTWDHNGLNPIAQTERLSATQAPQQDVDERFFANRHGSRRESSGAGP